MEAKDYAIGMLTIALLISFGFAVQQGATHVCRDSAVTMKCDRLSSTGFTCYPFATIKTGSKFCSTGWENILVEKKGDISKLNNSVIGAQYICGQESCIKIK